MPVYYKITDGTHIRKTPMKKLLAHVKKKAELTEYLSSNTGRQSGKCVVVAWSCRCETTHMDASHLASNHEEADTELLLHAVDATMSGATSIEIMSPDTDVFVYRSGDFHNWVRIQRLLPEEGSIYEISH